MALKKTITFKGITVQDAYIKVWRFEGEKTKVRVGVCYQADADNPPFDSQMIDCPYVLDGENPIKQAYEHIKTLPEFADAQDC